MGPWRIATPVCYEAILPGFVRKMVNQSNPHILVNLSSDGLFRDSQAPWIHLQLAQLRAVEHRRYLVRATDTGVSAIIDPVGRIVSHTGVQTRENLRAEVHMMQGKTVYARLGDWPGWLSLVLAALLLVRRSGRSPCP
jgi:apolipoprotein N-acyltransferase